MSKLNILVNADLRNTCHLANELAGKITLDDLIEDSKKVELTEKTNQTVMELLTEINDYVFNKSLI